MGYEKDYINPDLLSGKTNYKKDTEAVKRAQFEKAHNITPNANDMLLGDSSVVSDTTFKNPEKIGYSFDPLGAMAGDNPIAASMMTGIAAGQAIRKNVIIPRQQAKQQYKGYVAAVGAGNAFTGTNTQAISFKNWNKARRQNIRAARKAARNA
jgi:hypothetical protein